MNFIPTKLEGCFVIEPKIFNDERGYFLESYNEKTFQNGIGNQVQFVQDNQSCSSKGVLRGLHYQTGEHAQAKLVRVLQGEVLDVVVDLRVEQPTYKQTFLIELSEENKKQLFVPPGFAHAFVVLSKTAYVLYKCDEYYSKVSEGGIRFDDPELNIDWNLPLTDLIVSGKDLELPFLNQLNYGF